MAYRSFQFLEFDMRGVRKVTTGVLLCVFEKQHMQILALLCKCFSSNILMHVLMHVLIRDNWLVAAKHS